MGILQILASSTPLNKRNAPALVQCVEDLAKQARTMTPNVYLIRSDMVNAMFHPASGGLYVSEGILKAFNSANLHHPPSREMRAILAHEMGHVRFRWSQMGSMVAMVAGIPLAGMGAMYLIDKTNERLKHNNKLHPEKPEAFWDAFKEVTNEMRQAGPVHTYKEFWKYCNPSFARSLSKEEKYKNVSWGDTGLQEAKMFAVQAALLVPALAACRPIALANERQADRFAVALTGNREDLLSAFKKISSIAESNARKRAGTPLQKTWGKRVGEAIHDFLQHTIMAHPPLSERIATVSRMDAQAVARSYGL